MHHERPRETMAPHLMAGLLLALVAVSDARPASGRRSVRATTTRSGTHEKRIGEIEAKERGVPDQEQRADKITRDKVAAIRAP